ncbi:MAG: subclass B3 metallo-beta-lactamase [Sphingopyxis sp.]
MAATAALASILPFANLAGTNSPATNSRAANAMAAGAATPTSSGADPLTAPILSNNAHRWLGAQVPVRVHGNTYLVGFSGLNVALIRTANGLVLIDGGLPQGVAAVQGNMAQLGLSITDVRAIFSTEPHMDHAAGLAALARDSGAMVYAGRAAVAELRAGRNSPADPQYGSLMDFPSIARVRGVGNGHVVRVGGVAITALATPGHTAGSMSWSWKSCDGADCKTIVFASSINPVSADEYRFSAPSSAPVRAAYSRTFARLEAAPCDILLSAHPEQSGGDAAYTRLRAGVTPNPFINPGACRAYAARFRERLNARLAEEGAGATP